MTNTLIDEYHSKMAILHCLNEVLSFFDSLNKKLSLSLYLVDNFLDYFSFLLVNQKDSEVLISHCNRLSGIVHTRR